MRLACRRSPAGYREDFSSSCRHHADVPSVAPPLSCMTAGMWLYRVGGGHPGGAQQRLATSSRGGRTVAVARGGGRRTVRSPAKHYPTGPPCLRNLQVDQPSIHAFQTCEALSAHVPTVTGTTFGQGRRRHDARVIADMRIRLKWRSFRVIYPMLFLQGQSVTTLTSVFLDLGISCHKLLISDIRTLCVALHSPSSVHDPGVSIHLEGDQHGAPNQTLGALAA